MEKSMEKNAEICDEVMKNISEYYSEQLRLTVKNGVKRTPTLTYDAENLSTGHDKAHEAKKNSAKRTPTLTYDFEKGKE